MSEAHWARAGGVCVCGGNEGLDKKEVPILRTHKSQEKRCSLTHTHMNVVLGVKENARNYLVEV